MILYKVGENCESVVHPARLEHEMIFHRHRHR